MEIKIPFLPDFEDALSSGEKTLTSRTKWLGNKGDYFNAFGHTFIITELFTSSLSCVAQYYWHDEGCASSTNFKDIWCRIHPRAGWRPEQRVKCHRFINQKGLAFFHIHTPLLGVCTICGYTLDPIELLDKMVTK